MKRIKSKKHINDAAKKATGEPSKDDFVDAPTYLSAMGGGRPVLEIVWRKDKRGVFKMVSVRKC